MQQLLKRVFVTNWKTTAGGLLCLVSVLLFVLGRLDFEKLVVLLGIGAGWAGLSAKDGIREDVPVAREDVRNEEGGSRGQA
ncbi:hypothetical protein EJV47_04570 [Hymenobacter gummosus]|uniref:Uncharacterized protein n=1 Tax=Hymenobacter gummosus TaxID=1776032 RepID=A0A431U7Q8_9BACT|nr:hypothetical protein [Hymenobacter gummosus]RTQ52301.1 hypothetical protein EJV47_04570 [Hymenobacter gummosus]